jgi:hypothetical protein
LLGLIVLIIALAAGFMPDAPTDCAFLDRTDRFDPTCTTTSSARVRTFVEVVILWSVFGGLSWVLGRRSAAQDVAPA